MLLWQIWGDDLWQLYHKVTFDGYNKLIIINSNEDEIDVAVDIYSAWKEWSQQRDYLKWVAAMRSVGGDPLPGGAEETGSCVRDRVAFQNDHRSSQY